MIVDKEWEPSLCTLLLEGLNVGLEIRMNLWLSSRAKSVCPAVYS